MERPGNTGARCIVPLRKALAVGVVDIEVAEESGLRLDLGAVADHYDLHVGGVKIFSRGGEQIVRRKAANFFSIGFEIIVREVVEGDGGELREQTVLRGEAERENTADVVAGVGELGIGYGQG